jgi:predicted nucleotidyltransferase
MDKRAVIEKLRRHESELKAAGVVHVRLFGSVARGDQTGNSDVDLMADFDPAKRCTLVSMARLENMLSDLLGAPVDLAVANALRDPIKKRAEQEAVLAF